MKSARQGEQKALIATSLLRLSEAQFRDDSSEEAIRNASVAAGLFKELGQPAGQGRAMWAISAAQSRLGHAGEASGAAAEALALGRSCGDLYGAGNALNMLMFDEPDLGTRLKLLNQALVAFEAAGYRERQAVVTYNLGIAYTNLGLYRRARRLHRQACDIHAGTASASGEAAYFLVMAFLELEMGHLHSARRHLTAVDAIDIKAIEDRRMPFFRAVGYGRLAVLEGDSTAALRHYKHAAKLAHGAEFAAIEMNTLADLAQVHLDARQPYRSARGHAARAPAFIARTSLPRCRA